MAIIIEPSIEAKIGRDDHGKVTKQQVLECFQNHDGRYCWDKRPEHLDRSGNPSPWFVAETHRGERLLKIMFVRDGEDVHVKSAYPATETVHSIYLRHSK